MADNIRASYKPLHETLKKRGLSMSYLVDHEILTTTEVTRMNSGFVMPRKTSELCDYLQCSEEEIVEYYTAPE